jgi:hypothetical protein
VKARGARPRCQEAVKARSGGQNEQAERRQVETLGFEIFSGVLLKIDLLILVVFGTESS